MAPSGDEVLTFRNGDLVVLTNFGAASVEVPAGELLQSSAPLNEDGTIPPTSPSGCRCKEGPPVNASGIGRAPY
ncbi:hypothetical protein Jiend_40200 [Micromonospora endophytica]|nr:hypothetical protein Jiend_40200 [Micromonospora endophytica]